MNLWNELTTIFNFLSCIVYEIFPSILKSHTTKSVKLAFNEERAIWIRHNADSCGYSEDKDYENTENPFINQLLELTDLQSVSKYGRC